MAATISVRHWAVFQVDTVERRLGDGSAECNRKINCFQGGIKAPFGIATGEHATLVWHRVVRAGERHVTGAVHLLVVHVVSVVIVALERKPRAADVALEATLQ